MRCDNVSIKGIGSFLPKNVVTNDDISKKVSTSDEWIYNKLGIKERRVASINETTTYLGYQAALRAIENSSIEIDDIDMIIVATSSPDRISPSTACAIHNELKIGRNIPSFDINAVCTGFVYAVSIAASLISTKAYKNILIVASETYSKHTDWKEQHSVFFGDGAGAIILGESEKGWLSHNITSNGGGTGMTGFQMPLDKPFIMNGKEVWDQAIKVVPQSIKEILGETNLSVEDIKMVIPHQPSINILNIVASELGIGMDKVKTVMDKYANIAGSSIPIALEECIRLGEVKHGDKIVLSAIGSGWTWGSILLNYEE